MISKYLIYTLIIFILTFILSIYFFKVYLVLIINPKIIEEVLLKW